MKRRANGAGLLIALLACNSGSAAPGGPDNKETNDIVMVSVDPPVAGLSVGATVALVAIPQTADGDIVTGASVAWSTSAEIVASVSTSGVVTANAPGTATIVATVEGEQGSASVTVISAGMSVAPAALVKFVGDTVRLRAFDGMTDVSPNVTWSSSNSTVAGVTLSGLVTANSVGTASLSATLTTASTSVEMTVTPEPTTPEDINAHFPFCASSGSLKVCSDIDQDFSNDHAAHLAKTWSYFSSVFAGSPGNYTTMHYTDDLYGLYQRIFEFCPSVIIPGARNLTTCYDYTDGVYIWYVVPFIKPDFGTQLHEISHTFLYATYLAAEENVWFKEGTGMYYESGSFDAAVDLQISTPLPYIRDNFKKWRAEDALIPLEQLVQMSRDEFYGYPEPTKTYSQAGMLIFYLASEQESTWEQLIQRINDQTISNNADLLAFITSSTGLSVTDLESAYRQYASQF